MSINSKINIFQLQKHSSGVPGTFKHELAKVERVDPL